MPCFGYMIALYLCEMNEKSDDYSVHWQHDRTRIETVYVICIACTTNGASNSQFQKITCTHRPNYLRDKTRFYDTISAAL